MLNALSVEQLQDVRHAVKYYMNRHVSINNPRYVEYEQILLKIEDALK